MIEFFFELFGMFVFEFGDFITEQKVAKQAKYRHFYFWGGWLSCLVILIVSLIVGLCAGAVLAIVWRDKDFGWMLLLALFLLGLTFFSIGRFWRNLRMMWCLRRLYFQ